MTHHEHHAHDFKVGEHVLADFGDELGNIKGHILAHIVKDAHQNAAGETKYGIQAPDGSVHEMGYRETKAGEVSGQTFKRLA